MLWPEEGPVELADFFLDLSDVILWKYPIQSMSIDRLMSDATCHQVSNASRSLKGYDWGWYVMRSRSIGRHRERFAPYQRLGGHLRRSCRCNPTVYSFVSYANKRIPGMLTVFCRQ